MHHLQESQFNQIFVHYYTNRPGAYESVYYTAAVCAGADLTGVGGVYSSLCRELHVFLSRFLLRTFPCLFLSLNVSIYGLLRFEFHTKEIACACKSLCTRHCVLRYICKFINPRAIVVPSLRSGHYLALGFLNLRMYLGPSV